MAVDCAKVLSVIDSIVKEGDFVTQTKELVNTHCDTFTEDAENKLECEFQCLWHFSVTH